MPIANGRKFPTISWLQYQQQPASEELVNRWVSDGYGLGVVCGEVSNRLVCLDFDDYQAYEKWVARNPSGAQLPTAQSHRGRHVFYRAKGYQPSGKLHLDGEPIGDLLSNGKLVVLPPTTHPSGFRRHWVNEPFHNLPFHDLADLGLEMRAVAEIEPVNGKVQAGSRHCYLVKEAVRLASSRLPFEEAMERLARTNDEVCLPPLARDELGYIAAWAFEKDVPDSSSLTKTVGRNEGALVPPKPHSQGGEEWQSLFVPVREYMENDGPQDLEWIIEGLLARQFMIVLGGNSKSGKSCLVTALAHAVASGNPFLGKETSRTGVLWCAFEESRIERKMVLQEFGELPEGLYLAHGLPPIDQPSTLEQLRREVRAHGAGLIVIDPLYGAHSQEGLAGGTSGRNALKGLKSLCDEENVAAIVIHHLTKNVGAGLVRERMADSNQIVATASMDVLMETEETPEGGRLIILKGAGRGNFAHFRWLIRSGGITNYELLDESYGGKAGGQSELLVERCLQDCPAPLTAREIHEKSGVPLATVRNVLTELKRTGRVRAERLGKEFAYELAEELAESA